MRTFAEMNTSGGDVCPICKTQNKGEIVLIGIVGTEEGMNMQAKQFHLKCLELYYDPKLRLIYQRTK